MGTGRVAPTPSSPRNVDDTLHRRNFSSKVQLYNTGLDARSGITTILRLRLTSLPLQTELVGAESNPVFTGFENFFTLAFTVELCVNALAYFFAPFFKASA